MLLQYSDDLLLAKPATLHFVCFLLRAGLYLSMEEIYGLRHSIDQFTKISLIGHSLIQRDIDGQAIESFQEIFTP